MSSEANSPQHRELRWDLATSVSDGPFLSRSRPLRFHADPAGIPPMPLLFLCSFFLRALRSHRGDDVSFVFSSWPPLPSVSRQIRKVFAMSNANYSNIDKTDRSCADLIGRYKRQGMLGWPIGRYKSLWSGEQLLEGTRLAGWAWKTNARRSTARIE